MRYVVVGLALSLLVGCSSGSSQESQDLVSPTVEAGASTPSSSPSPSEPAAPSPSPSPSPTLNEISAVDLTDALPTNPMLTKVQGFTFTENDKWDTGDDEGPEWVADAPLTKKQRKQVGAGTLKSVKPVECEAEAIRAADGWTTSLADSEFLQAVGYSKKENKNRYYKSGQVTTWLAAAFKLSEDAPQGLAQNMRAFYNQCARYTTIDADGDIEKINRKKRFEDLDLTLQSSGNALVEVVTATQGSRELRRVLVVEPIGNVMYQSIITILGEASDQWKRSTNLYNRLADNIADVQGTTRLPVDLLNGEPVVPDPSDYTSIAKPQV